MSLDIEYQSMSRPAPLWRKVTPHTLVYDGLRWHTRAFCYLRNRFRDFLFARIYDIGNIQPDYQIDAKEDTKWHEVLKLRITPHPGLSDHQKRIIERDYGMENGFKILEVRAAQYFYLERKLMLDENCEERPPKQQQIILANRDEIIKRIQE